MAEYSSAPRSYVPNAGQYAEGLRSYSSNPFAGASGSSAPPAMAEHLSRAPDLDADVMAAYKHYGSNNPDPSGQTVVPDVERLWRLSPKSPVFQAGYAHNPLIMQYAEQLRQARNPKPVGQEPAYDPYADSYAPAAS
jgi:hypothetical protein